ncbi:MAG: DUF58 domain-containing protein [Burkholderiales bacterium]
MAEAIVLEHALASARGGAYRDLKRQRVYIFPTRQGFLFSLLLVIMLLGAVNYTNSMAYLLTFLLGSVFMVCMLHTYRNLRGLIIKVTDAEPVFAGEVAAFPLLFDNRPGYERTAVQARVRRARRDTANAIDVDLAAGELHRTLAKAEVGRRGIFTLDRLMFETRFPLGLFRSWAYLDKAPRCVVYPRPEGPLPLPATEEFEAENQTGRRPGTDDFTGFRAYRAGDSMRSIDWKAFARERGLFAKRFTGAGARRLALRWDATPARAGTEARLSQLCRWVLDAERQGWQYALDIPGRFVDHGSGPGHRNTCLEALARNGLESTD